MRRTWKKAKPKQEKRFRANEQIRVPEVFLVDDSGEKIGRTPTAKALEMAREADLDLVEVNPKADPPITKIMDYGQFKYEKEKKTHKKKMQQKSDRGQCYNGRYEPACYPVRQGLDGNPG